MQLSVESPKYSGQGPVPHTHKHRVGATSVVQVEVKDVPSIIPCTELTHNQKKKKRLNWPEMSTSSGLD